MIPQYRKNRYNSSDILNIIKTLKYVSRGPNSITSNSIKTRGVI